MKKEKQTYSCIDLSKGTIYVFDNYFDYRRFVKKGKLPKNWGKTSKKDTRGDTHENDKA